MPVAGHTCVDGKLRFGKKSSCEDCLSEYRMRMKDAFLSLSVDTPEKFLRNHYDMVRNALLNAMEVDFVRCRGCGHIEGIPIPSQAIACCPESTLKHSRTPEVVPRRSFNKDLGLSSFTDVAKYIEIEYPNGVRILPEENT